MAHGDMDSRAILNPYDVPYYPLKFVLWIQRHPAYRKEFRACGNLALVDVEIFWRDIQRFSCRIIHAMSTFRSFTAFSSRWRLGVSFAIKIPFSKGHSRICMGFKLFKQYLIFFSQMFHFNCYKDSPDNNF